MNMKKLFAVLVVVVFLCGISASTYASSIITKRHVSPIELPQYQLNPYSLYQLTKLISSALVAENYSAVSNLTKALKLIHASGTAKQLVSQLTVLIETQSSTLNINKNAFNEIQKLLSMGGIEDARALLEEIKRNITISAYNQQEIYLVTKKLDSSFKTNTTQLAKILDELLDRQINEIRNLDEKIQALGEKQLCVILIESYKNEAWVGEEAWVKVKSYASPLVQTSGVLRLYAKYNEGDIPLLEITIPLDTEDEVRFNLPYLYNDSISIYATLSPLSEDFRPCASNVVHIKLKWIRPEIFLGLTNFTATPNSSLSLLIINREPIELVGTVEYPWGSQNVTLASGENSFTIYLPPYLNDGLYSIALRTKPLGIIGPGNYSLTIEVKRIQTQIMLEAPRILVSGLPSNIKLCVFVNQVTRFEKPPDGVLVLSVSGWTSSIEINNSCVTARLHTPLLVSGGGANLTVVFKPSNPAYSNSVESTNIIVLNPLVLLLGISMLVVSAKKSLSIVRNRASLTIPSTEVKEKLLQERYANIRYETTYSLAYILADVMEKLSGVPRQPWETLREYYAKIKDALGEASSRIEELIAEVEKVVYGASEAPSWVTEKLKELKGSEKK